MELTKEEMKLCCQAFMHTIATYLDNDERMVLYGLMQQHLEDLMKGDWDAIKEEVSQAYLIMHKLTKKEDNS